MRGLIEFTTGIRSQLVIEAYVGWLNKHENVLDVGCGDGVLSSILQKKFSLKLTGCDMDDYLKKKIPFTLMEKESLLPFSDKSFDVVLFNDTLHHTTFFNQKNIIKEALRVSHKVLIFEDEPTLVGAITDWSINKFHNIHMPVTLTFRSHNHWMKLFNDMGINHEYKKVRKSFMYPFIHEAFFLKN